MMRRLHKIINHIFIKIANALIVLTSPSCWPAIDVYNEELDKWLVNALKDPHFEEASSPYSINLNGIALWCANMPWRCGYDSNNTYFKGGRPARSTMVRFKRAVEKYTKGEMQSKRLNKNLIMFSIISEQHFGNLTFEEVLIAVKEKYPENFL